MAWGLGFGVKDLRLGGWSLGSRGQDSELKDSGFGFRGSGLGIRVQGFGVEVSDFGFGFGDSGSGV